MVVYAVKRKNVT